MKTRPNILLLFTDQQRYDSLANTHTGAIRDSLKTPNFDRLCREGTRFDCAYTPNPVCIPARYNMITGLPAKYHGHPDNCHAPCPRELPLLPQILSNAGYNTHAIGKMHFVPNAREHHGFNRMELMEETPQNHDDDDYLLYLQAQGQKVIHQHGVRQLLYHQPQRSLVPEEMHGSHWVADRSIEFLKQSEGDARPFFLKASWIHPHPPYNVPERLCDMYRDAALPERIERMHPQDDRSDLVPSARTSFELGDGMLDDPERFRRHQELYHASVSFVDQQIGRVLDELDRCGLAENTLVVTASDHGEMLGNLDCFQKESPYEGASHIPMIMRFPGVVPANHTDDTHFVDLNDILPTFLDAAGVEYPGSLELPGSSLLTLDHGRDRDYQYVENGRGPKRWVSLRNKAYKFIYSYYGGYEALYDMQADPKEQNNLLRNEQTTDAHAEIRNDMFQRLVQYEKRWGLDGMVEWNDMMTFEPYPLTYKSNARHWGRSPWYQRLNEQQRQAFGSEWDEVCAAVKDESTVKLSQLDLEGWQKNCNVPDAVIQEIRDSGL